MTLNQLTLTQATYGSMFNQLNQLKLITLLFWGFISYTVEYQLRVILQLQYGFMVHYYDYILQKFIVNFRVF